MKREALAGRTFGFWEVQNEYIRENNRVKWLCKCRCGTKRYIDAGNLASGKSRSCGCLSRELSKMRIKDLTGQTFGFLKVIRHSSENRRDRVCWVCECLRCGNECVVTGHELQQGKTKSCGCLKKESAATAVDLTGRRFGRLTARHPIVKRDPKGSIIWHCSCKCGGETDVPQDRLVSGNTKSCGCLKREVAENLPATLHYIDGTCIEFLERKQRVDNTSGHTGVYKKKNGRYSAGIGFKKKRYSLGTYDTFAEAVRVREYAEDILHRAFIEQYRRRQSQGKVEHIERDKLPACERYGSVSILSGGAALNALLSEIIGV